MLLCDLLFPRLLLVAEARRRLPRASCIRPKIVTFLHRAGCAGCYERPPASFLLTYGFAAGSRLDNLVGQTSICPICAGEVSPCPAGTVADREHQQCNTIPISQSREHGFRSIAELAGQHGMKSCQEAILTRCMYRSRPLERSH